MTFFFFWPKLLILFFSQLFWFLIKPRQLGQTLSFILKKIVSLFLEKDFMIEIHVHMISWSEFNQCEVEIVSLC